MANLLLISVAEADTRVALMEDGRLAEFYVERQGQHDPVRNIYKGRVLKLLPGMAAAFVDIGLARPAYLYAEDTAPQGDEFFHLWLKDEVKGVSARRRRLPGVAIEDLLHEGQEVLVQVLRNPLGNKGARLTSHVTLAGHYLVYMPTLPHLGVSRRIADEGERLRLKAILEELRPRQGGLIARTASQGRGQEPLGRELKALEHLWEKILRKKDTAAPPALLHQDLEVARRVVREMSSKEVDRVVVDEAEVFEQVQNYLETLNPYSRYRVELYGEAEPLFSHFGVEVDWQKLLAPRVWLKSGGYLLFDRTEALTAVDVNTGRFVGRRRLEDTILKTNIEAAREVARQLRLRNLGGLIVIDFIDMENAAHRDLVHQELLESLKKDRAKTTILPISALGLVEMTRQRLRDSLAQLATEPCEACGGSGVRLSALTLAHDLMRLLSAEAREFPGCRLAVAAHPEITAILRQEAGGLLKRLKAQHQVEVTLTDQPHFRREHYEITRELLGR